MFCNTILKLFQAKAHILAPLYKRNFRIAIVGSAGGVGAPLTLLLKQSPMVSKLSCMDLLPHTLGVAMDCSHIEGRAKVKAYKGMKSLGAAVKGAEIVVITAGGAGKRKTGTPRAAQFKFNGLICKNVCDVTAAVCPNAIILVVTNPVNSLIPMISEIYKKHKVYDPRKIIGLSTLDTVRSNRFLAAKMNINPLCVHVPVIGGHSGESIIPIFSQSTPKNKLNEKEIEALTKKVQTAGPAVVIAKNIDGKGSATLAMAYSAARYIYGLGLARNGVKNVVESSYIRSDCHKDVKYIATPCVLGPWGIEANLGIPKINKYEQKLLDVCIKTLKGEIQMGVDYIVKKQYEEKKDDKKDGKKDDKKHGKGHGKKDDKKHGKGHGKKDDKNHGKPQKSKCKVVCRKQQKAKQDAKHKKDHKDDKCKKPHKDDKDKKCK